MRSDKTIMDGTSNIETVEVFYSDYLSVRTTKVGKLKGKQLLSAKTLECYHEALVDLNKDQLAYETYRFDMPASSSSSSSASSSSSSSK